MSQTFFQFIVNPFDGFIASPQCSNSISLPSEIQRLYFPASPRLCRPFSCRTKDRYGPVLVFFGNDKKSLKTATTKDI
jgi:hypothetical protein